VIRLTKGPKPPVLERLGQKWTDDLLEKVRKGEDPSDYLQSRYRHEEIKDALVGETHGKCAYCESKVMHIAYGDVEHIIPKSTDRSLTFAWDNLTLACDRCNTNKAAFVGNHDRLIDPYATEPLDHLDIFGPIILAKSGDGDGKITESEIDLNRISLVERRIERLKALGNILNAMSNADDPDVRDTIRRDIEQRELAADKEFAAFAREFYVAATAKIESDTQQRS
jgi:5-methylcytosine-specific restriction endonuclease McrA